MPDTDQLADHIFKGKLLVTIKEAVTAGLGGRSPRGEFKSQHSNSSRGEFRTEHSNSPRGELRVEVHR